MSRLKLKRFKVHKPASEILTHYLRYYTSKDLYFNPDTLPDITSEAMFGNQQPLILDLGCGKSEYINALAHALPEVNFVGFDLHWKSLWYAINKAHEAKLPNVRFIRADVRRVLVKVPDGTAQEASLLFPPPVMKHNRLDQDMFTAALLGQIHRVLTDNGGFIFMTDDPDYFAKKTALIAASGFFHQISESQAIEGGITAYQQRWEAYGIESLRAEYRRLP